MATRRVAFTVHGDVQGVFFRKFTKEHAEKYSLTGWVRNTNQGKVEGEAQGNDEAVGKLLEDLEQGPSGAHVVKVDKADVDVKEGEGSFEKIKNS
ncbi:MAG: hypothetical protein M1816_007794 [Peltula sp. TS41687]|nr:MAG: hypothetical protein M1816_007794 [Peltula sp. TS41687]